MTVDRYPCCTSRPRCGIRSSAATGSCGGWASIAIGEGPQDVAPISSRHATSVLS